MPRVPDFVSKRRFHPAELSAFAVLALSASVQAAPPRLIFEQLTVTSGDGCASFYPAMNDAGTLVAFTSFCDLVGQNPDQNAEVFAMNTNGSNLHQLTSTISGPGAIRAQQDYRNKEGTTSGI